MSKLSLLLATAGLAASAVAYTPAYSNTTASEKNSTFLAGWRSDQGQGTLNQGVTLLSNGTGTTNGSTYYGVVVYFNETSALNQSSTPVPWIAFVSCDPDNPSTQATLALPFDTNGTVATNSTLENNNSTMTNSTDLTNSTMSGMNSTDSTTMNTTTTINGVNSTYLPDVFSLAAQLGASSVLLYSQQSESCQLNFTANAMFNNTIPIFSSPSRDVTDRILSSQFANIDESYRYFNSSLISSSASNLTSIISSPNNNTLPTRFLIGRLTAAYDKNDSSNGVVATIGRAPTSTRTSQGSAQTGGSDPAPSSGAERIFGSTLALLAAGLVVIVG
ncbi:hypothetical protein JCM5350_007435 [Sporobolomyces pararoseus]